MGQAREGAQMRALAREVDLEILSPISWESRGGDPKDRLDAESHDEAMARAYLVSPYVEKLLEDALDELRSRASGEGVLRIKDPCQAEAAVRNYVRVLNQALVTRLGSFTTGRSGLA